MTNNPGSKFRRSEQQFTLAQKKTMQWLVDNDYGIEAVMERFGLTELAAMEYVTGKRVKHEPQWQVRWDDEAGNRHIEICETFKAAREFHAALRDVEWSRVERV